VLENHVVDLDPSRRRPRDVIRSRIVGHAVTLRAPHPATRPNSATKELFLARPGWKLLMS
jgi:hypothetical protein